MIQTGRPQRKGAISAEINALEDKKKEHVLENEKETKTKIIVLIVIFLIVGICLL